MSYLKGTAATPRGKLGGCRAEKGTQCCPIFSFCKKSHSPGFLCKTSRFLTGIKENTRKPFSALVLLSECMSADLALGSTCISAHRKPTASLRARGRIHREPSLFRSRKPAPQESGRARNSGCRSSTLLGHNLGPQGAPTKERSQGL